MNPLKSGCGLSGFDLNSDASTNLTPLTRSSFKKTFRKNIAYDGLLFNTWWKIKKIDRPDIVAICDMSRSVEKAVRFLLLILYNLNETVARIRTFIFCSKNH